VADPRGEPRHWRHVIRRQNPDYLYAEDLGSPGTKIDVEIVDSGPGKVKNPGESKDVIWLAFDRAKKRLGIGATGCKTLREITGSDDWRDWRGWITLVVIRTKYFDKITGSDEETDAIRIARQRPPAPRSPAPAPAPAKSATPTAEEQAEILRLEREGKA